ncbi:MAG: hypothetical protein PHX74_06740 [Candidatus Sumerlaeales bacterium]|nr:hypothetical protein [Candidatus Sumerlaeales bacterium]
MAIAARKQLAAIAVVRGLRDCLCGMFCDDGETTATGDAVLL